MQKNLVLFHKTYTKVLTNIFYEIHAIYTNRKIRFYTAKQ